MTASGKKKDVNQLVWAAALIMMGVCLFFYIPRDPRFVEMGQSSAKTVYIKICFYFIGVLLVGGGIRKLLMTLGVLKTPDAGLPSQKNDSQAGR